MTPERWRQVRRLFEQASELPAGERARMLGEACVGDRALRDEIEELLAADQVAGSLLEDAAQWPDDGSSLVGQTLGSYRLEETIGEGGSSVVYRASRADRAYRQQVAIKVQRRGLERAHLGGRFHTERQILARLDHPNIARLLDAGSVGDGRPYVVMEYVEGISIDEHCDRHEFSIGERLALFRKICHAVQYAHQNLIVHRDIKPGNILVTADGTPKLLDFGIAKLLTPERAAEGAETTVGWLRLMTPGYASPEQARGGSITTASDVYSLGVVLYALLCGRPPYRLGNLSAVEVERLLQQVVPLPPSAAVRAPAGTTPDDPKATTPDAIAAARGLRPEGLRRRLQGDLDTIVAKAMHKDPRRRYASPAALAEDLDRHLEGRPVEARGDGFAYRSSRFLRRHWLPAAVATAVAGLVIAFAVTTNIQSRQVAAERDRVLAERDKNAEIVTLLKDIFEQASPEVSGGRAVTAQEILDAGVARIAGRLGDHPDTRATMLETLGEVNLGLGRHAVAAELLGQAVEIRRQLPDGDPIARATGLDLVGRATLAAGDAGRAATFFDEALDVALLAGGRARPQIAASLRGLAECARILGDYQLSEQRFEEALAVDEAQGNEAQLSYAESLRGLAMTHLQRGDLDSAQRRTEQALALERRHLGSDHPRIAASLQRLMLILLHQDDFDRARVVGEEALALQETLYDGDHPRLHETVDSLARVAVAQRDFGRAGEHFRRAIEIGRRAFGEQDPRYARSLNNLGDLLRRTGDPAGAERLARQALAIHRRDADGDRTDLASSIFNVAVLVHDRGAVAESLPLFREALAVLRQATEPGHHTLAFPLVRLGRILSDRGELQEAELLLREALTVRRQVLPAGHRLTADAAGALGITLLRLARHAEAEPLLIEVYETYKESQDSDPSKVDTWRRQLQALYRAWGRPDDAARLVDEPKNDASP